MKNKWVIGRLLLKIKKTPERKAVHTLSSEWMLLCERSRARMMHRSPLCLLTQGATLSSPPCLQVQQDEGRKACAWLPAGPPSASDHVLRWVLITLWAATSLTWHLNSTAEVNNNQKSWPFISLPVESVIKSPICAGDILSHVTWPDVGKNLWWKSVLIKTGWSSCRGAEVMGDVS